MSRVQGPSVRQRPVEVEAEVVHLGARLPREIHRPVRRPRPSNDISVTAVVAAELVRPDVPRDRRTLVVDVLRERWRKVGARGAPVTDVA